jgi:hypothetical protein
MVMVIVVLGAIGVLRPLSTISVHAFQIFVPSTSYPVRTVSCFWTDRSFDGSIVTGSCFSSSFRRRQRHLSWALSSSPSDDNDEKMAMTRDDDDTNNNNNNKLTEAAEKEKAVGNLVANDEWEGLTMELTELIKTAVVEDMKANAREFLGKDEYKLGDISKELDSRIKSEVANMRGKEVSNYLFVTIQQFLWCFLT